MIDEMGMMYVLVFGGIVCRGGSGVPVSTQQHTVEHGTQIQTLLKIGDDSLK
jgi:hypothetical protein